MKKTILALSAAGVMAAAFVGCSEPELKNVRGEVKSVEITNDTLKSMVVAVGDEEKTVTLLDARFQNGIALQGDSIILDYIDGRDNTLRALVVTVLPKEAKYFEPSDTLITKETVAADSVK